MMKSNGQLKTVMGGAAILTISSLIAKVLSAVYRIPLQNLVGNVGFYIYQQVYPIYGIGMTFALSGLPVLISKMIAEQSDLERRLGLAKRILLILSGFAIVIFLGLQFSASFLAVQMGDPRLDNVIKAVSWMFLLMPFLSTSRGYFQGTLNMLPTAISQVVEQVVRVAIIILVAVLAYQNHWDLYKMGADAMLSSPISAIFSSIVLVAFCWPLFKCPSRRPNADNWQLTKQLLVEGGTICLLSSLMIMMQLVDSFTIRKGLIASGLNGLASQDIKGVYDRAQPIVQLGLVIGTAFASATLPSLAKAVQVGAHQQFDRMAQLMMRSSLVATVIVTVGMMSLMPAINFVLFGNPEGSTTLAIYCFSIIVVTLITTYNGILQSMGDFRTGFYAVVVSIVVKILLTGLLVSHLGIVGGSISTVIAVTCGFAVNWLRIKQSLQIPIYPWRFIWRLLIVVISMILAVKLTQRGLGMLVAPLTSRLLTIFTLGMTIMVGAITAIVLILKLKLFSRYELMSLPIVDHLIK
ncbi:putative polysaccharide biosynthesis protein [Lactobacillaceae bacterium Scapto_B20]